MSRIRFKGGAWTNSEDEVLRASLTVYGLQNWERVASMLVRKTAAQCRERWENYLDPRLHIREAWTAEEEEQLVQLQSLFTNQWNLIARELRHRTGMNRPAWLCEEHYHTLLDALEYERQQKEGGNNKRNESLTLEDFLAERRRHRAYHQGHETRASKADAVNSDVFEKEMVEFAVSRLANQDGKKGLRKERKKQLQHTSFLAKLQSNREAIESGTLSAKAKKRMERAMLEDRAGPSDTRLQDEILEDDDVGSSGGSDVGNDESKRGQKGVFRPIDLGADKQEAGIQAKHRELVKNLSADMTRLQQEATVSEGINVELLRLASGTSGSANRQVEDKKKAPPITSKSSAAPGASPATADLDHLFASLPEAILPEQESVVGARASVDDLFGTLPEPLLGGRVSRDKFDVAVATPEDYEAEEEEEAEVSYTVSLSEPSQAPLTALNFSTEEGRSWLREAKRRVLVESESVFLNRKRVRHHMSSPTEKTQLMMTTKNGEEEKGHLEEERKKKEEKDDDKDESTWCIVRALVEQQLPATARDLLESKVVPDGFLAKKAKREKEDSSARYNNTQEYVKERGGNEEEKDTTIELAACVAAVQREDSADFWKDVGATEATVQLEELVHHQREQVAANTAKDTEAYQHLERMVRICFAGSRKELRGEDIINRVCVYWGWRLEEAQRRLAFYSAIREVERQEMQRRINDATCRLTEIEQKERTLQERYRSMRLAE
ncbi:hypothetical protein C3747_24g312 [Trypanosoma cruzi]|uniref:Cell division control protein n=2 Tax=Trypanosoma cruzi TaxID=5693 RepID=Q4DFE9_TRYCC|nr:hypothetical protein, conserved [Trypanosoma cruzi]EAN91255.1 hypothetical protein, conserved [Trypanosoma cruzi]PWV16265.1 hypothetical protein C3747_24g312 [Trypanosoma cruzi]RNC53851.1 putative cell division control protein [Trypanosoma cruzi]|eukprot:XP_813106.1 hypothetical protein [Trypanosoma cruzi strain CL Brener]